MSLARLFVRLWRVREVPPHDPDVIIAICYGVLPDRLADGTLATLREAIRLADIFPRAVIAFGNAAICFDKSEIAEHKFKMAIIETEHFPQMRLVVAPRIYNTVTEAKEIKKELERSGIRAREIAIVAAEAHSRAVMYIYRRIFPDTRMALVYIPFETEYQPDHTVTLQTGPWFWIVANILRQIALRVLGLERVGKVTHYTRIR